ncbi:MAG TPA: ABC transporter ATP-binding protein [Planctomycetota bacterium]|nr:ABC transporter ATP-binding protein [Planctomycetota bacterium]
MDTGSAASLTVSNRKTLSRLLFCFLPHSPLLIATLISSGVYAGAMTARVGLLYPILRLVGQEVPADQQAAAGIPAEFTFVRSVAEADSKRSAVLARVNAILDRMDQYWIDSFGYEGGTPREQARFGTLMSLLVLYLGVTIAAAMSNFVQLYLRALLVVRILISLRVRLLQNLLQQPLAFYNEQKRGELISRMGNDVHAATTCLNTVTGPLIQQPLLILVPVVALVAVVWWSGLLVLLFLGTIMYSLRKQTRKIHRRAKVRQRTVARVTEAMVQMFSGIRVVKAFGLEKVKVDQYTKRNEEFSRDAMAAEASKAWTRTWMELLINLIVVMALLGAILLVGIGGEMPWGPMLIFIGFTAQIYRPSKLLVHAYTDLVDELAGTARVFEFMDLEPGMPDKPGAIPLSEVVGTVRFEDVSFSYGNNGGAVPVLDHVNLEVPAGQVVALVGHSGAGKSTLVNLVPRFYDPVQGRITIDGTDIREFKRESLLQQIAIVTQEPFLFNTTIRENIAYGRAGATIHEIIAAAQAAHIHDFILTLPQGYDTVVGERGANLSGGQGQRLTIARAIIRDPKILILDEATSNLDTASEKAVQEALQNLMEGRTTLVIAHRLPTVQHADKICVMQDGRIAEMGTHRQLLQSDTLYRRLYKLQFARE